MPDQAHPARRLHIALWILGGVILLMLAFGLGLFVGTHDAAFRARFGENYVRNFFGAAPAGGEPYFVTMGPPNSHGAIGTVLDVGTSSLSVVDSDGDEVSVAVPTSTVIQEGGSAIAIGAIRRGDMVAVIGAPNGSGQIAARFIRVFPMSAPSSTMPTGTPAGPVLLH